MSAKTKVLCERGKFFIETGTSHSFKEFIRNSAISVAKYIPASLVKRIGDLINSGDIVSATTLWMKACEIADHEPVRRRNTMIFYVSYVVIAATALVALLRTL